ncbi:hypothetical protein chiPu_0032977, partial [Chiloscyllium punctatum]|nr:hypothetical protein [Chiloscyllium punctatum]
GSQPRFTKVLFEKIKRELSRDSRNSGSSRIRTRDLSHVCVDEDPKRESYR